MALSTTTDELFGSEDVDAKKRIYPERSASKKFGPDGLGTTVIAAGTLVAFDTSNAYWVPWTDSGANDTDTTKGILWPDALTQDATYEKIATVMLRGEAHRDDIELNGESQANIDTELQTGLRDIGIDIQGLDDVR